MGESFFDAFGRTLEQELGIELTAHGDVQGDDMIEVSNWMLQDHYRGIVALAAWIQLFIEAEDASNLRGVIIGVVLEQADRHLGAALKIANIALQDPDWAVRLELAEHAWKLGRDGQDLLKKLAEDRDEAVREAAVNGLGFAA